MYRLILLLFLISAPTQAEIYKTAVPSESGMKFYWWPVLPKIKGWHHERNFSLMYSSNTQAPDGFTFVNSESVIYAKAIFKPRRKNIKSLNELIESDKNEFIKNNKNLIINEVNSLTTSDGNKLKSFTFSPKVKGNWERVSYGEENDFYLIFTLSSRSKNGYSESLKDYEKFISNYKQNP